MRLSPRSVVFAGLLLTSGALAGSWQALMSPGPVAAAHADLAGNCDACHLVFDGVPDSKCLDCHDGLAARITAEQSYHATVAGQSCSECHSDHLGADASLTTAEALEAFDHASTGFTLSGEHSDVACETCHNAPIHEMAATCIECHTEADPHQSALGPDCDACHVPLAWELGLRTTDEHDTPMHGNHADLLCEDCHQLGEHLEPNVPCTDCHLTDDTHDGTTAPCSDCHNPDGWKPAQFTHGPCTCTLAGAHQTAECLDCHEGFDFSDTPTLCSGCHTATPRAVAGQDGGHDDLGECSRCHEATTWAENTFDHNRSSFNVEGVHLMADCAGCHSGLSRQVRMAADDTPPELTFGGTATDCAACHQDQVTESHGDFGACEDCHTVDHAGFIPSTFDHQATTGFALHGRHTDLSCQTCHATLTEGYPGATP